MGSKIRLHGESLEHLRKEWTELEREHEKMHELFDALESAEDREAALEAMTRLEKFLQHHFLREEKPEGLYATLGFDTEESQWAQADHVKLHRLLVSSRMLVEASTRADPEPIRNASRLLGEDLRSHEQEERKLVEGILKGN